MTHVQFENMKKDVCDKYACDLEHYKRSSRAFTRKLIKIKSTHFHSRLYELNIEKDSWQL